MTEKMKTVCVGRYLVDVPTQSVVSTSSELIDGFAIDTIEESKETFQKRMAAREAEIGARAISADGRRPGGMIEAHDLFIPGMIGRTFVYGRTRTHGFENGKRVDVEWVSAESNVHIGDLSFSLSADYLDENEFKAAEALLAQLRLRGENEIPTVAGFCIWRAVFAEPLPIHGSEHSVMHLGLPRHPDLALTLASMPGGGTGANLIARTAEADASTEGDVLSRMSKLRERSRTINGINGEEVLVRAREFNFTTTYGFNWETQGAPDDVLRPYLSLELQTGLSDRPGGKPTDTSLHEDALLTLWDRIASSIRPHMASPPQAATPRSAPTG